MAIDPQIYPRDSAPQSSPWVYKIHRGRSGSHIIQVVSEAGITTAGFTLTRLSGFEES